MEKKCESERVETPHSIWTELWYNCTNHSFYRLFSFISLCFVVPSIFIYTASISRIYIVVVYFITIGKNFNMDLSGNIHFTKLIFFKVFSLKKIDDILTIFVRREIVDKYKKSILLTLPTSLSNSVNTQNCFKRQWVNKISLSRVNPTTAYLTEIKGYWKVQFKKRFDKKNQKKKISNMQK